MPNWCTTYYTFKGDENEIKDFAGKLTAWRKQKPIATSDFGSDWLGNLLVHVGINPTTIHCRGSLDIVKLIDGNTLKMESETAWEPMPEVFDALLKALGYESIEYSYCSEEPGMEIYTKSDPLNVYPEEYAVDVYIDNYAPEEETAEDAMLYKLSNKKCFAEEEMGDVKAYGGGNTADGLNKLLAYANTKDIPMYWTYVEEN